MNTFRTFLLIAVFVIQISGFLTGSNSEPFGLCEYSGKICEDFKREVSSKSAVSSKDYIHKKEEAGYINSPVNREEAPLKCVVQTPLIKKRMENLPVNVAPCQNKRPSRKAPVSIYVRSIGTTDAELF
jgi:hypothetical protein